VLGEATLPLLAEDQFPFGDDVELALFAGEGLCLVRRLLVQLGRETRSPAVIAVSDGAVQDLDSHSAETIWPRERRLCDNSVEDWFKRRGLNRKPRRAP
jgi:hypothetical protein